MTVTTNKIIEQFNQAVKHIENAYEVSAQQDLGEAQNELEKSATSIYRAIEWALKNYLRGIHGNLQSNIIEGNNFHKKLELFIQTASPSPDSLKINCKIISELKQTVRNDPEHSGFIPHFSSLYEVLIEGRKIISNYIGENNLFLIPKKVAADLPNDESWSRFSEACDHFNRNKNYILISGDTLNFKHDKLEYLGLIDWSLIVDFDQHTEKDGLHRYVKPIIENRRKVHLITSGDHIGLSTFNSCYWLAAKGLIGRSDTLVDNFKNWSRKNTRYLENLLEKYFRAFGDKPVNVVITSEEPSYVQKLCELIYNCAGDRAKFIYAVPNPSRLLYATGTYEGICVEISIPQISHGILRIRNLYNPQIQSSLKTLPAKDEEFVTIELTDFIWIEEDFELLYQEIINDMDLFNEGEDERERYYKGREIGWKGLHLRYDIDRERTELIRRRIEKGLRERNTEKYTIHHFPGIGGTTIGKRIAWDFRMQYPVLNLKEYNPSSSIEKIYRVFDITKKTVLVLAEASRSNIDQIEKLFNEILSRNFPCVLLVIQRKDVANEGSSHSFTIEDVLTDLELRTFVSRYAELRPIKRKQLELLESSLQRRERHPFYLGLTAFEKDFIGLENFVDRNLDGATEVQKKIISIIAFCYYYGQKAVSSMMFTNLIMVSENSVVLLDQHLNTNLLSLVVNDEDIKWRPIHYLVAEELLIQNLSGGGENRHNWRYYLTELAILLIDLIASKSSLPSDSDTELLKRLFVYRGSQETLGKDEESLFSKFVENGLQTDEARLKVLRHLVSSFPEESHYWAHLARFYSLKLKNHPEALEAISKAIDLSDSEDYVLYHMKGMCLRTMSREVIDKWWANKQCPIEVIHHLRQITEESGEEFGKSRELNSSNEHAYISHIQMLISVIDFSFSISRFDKKGEFLRNMDLWLQDKLDLAEELLDTMKLQTQMRDHNPYVESCDLNLQELYENFSLVIEGWNNLLSKSEAAKPLIRRSIVRAYVRRAKSWNFIDKKDLDKIIKLIEENIQEEPQKGSNIHIWFKAARESGKIDVNTAIDKISRWRALTNLDESIFYLGVLHSIQAIEGTSVSKIKAEQLMREISEKKRHSPFRTYCYEWYGVDAGLGRIISSSDAVKRTSSNEMVFEKKMLKRLSGKISSIKGPEAGEIELDCGLRAFFIPARGEGFARERDVNMNVNFYLGFSHDGLRAFEVESEEY